MKKYLKIDKAIYEIDENAKTYKFVNRNFDWAKTSEEENEKNKKSIEGYSRIMEEKSVVNKNKTKLIDELKNKKVSDLINNLFSDNATLKYQSSKALIDLSENDPMKVYSEIDKFTRLFENENNILKWTGIIIIGNLAKIDKDKQIDKILPKLFSLLNSGKMITAGNTSQSLARIAKAKPYLEDKITSELLKVEKYKYDTRECENIACGHVIEAFEFYLGKPDKKVFDFAKRQTKNSRSATAKKAQEYIKLIKKD